MLSIVFCGELKSINEEESDVSPKVPRDESLVASSSPERLLKIEFLSVSVKEKKESCSQVLMEVKLTKIEQNDHS